MSEGNGAVILESGCAYYAHHIPTGEEFLVIGFNHEYNKVALVNCTHVSIIGWTPVIKELSDCENFEFARVLSAEDIQYRETLVGSNWE